MRKSNQPIRKYDSKIVREREREGGRERGREREREREREKEREREDRLNCPVWARYSGAVSNSTPSTTGAQLQPLVCEKKEVIKGREK